jgi:hypothetical protein
MASTACAIQLLRDPEVGTQQAISHCNGSTLTDVLTGLSDSSFIEQTVINRPSRGHSSAISAVQSPSAAVEKQASNRIGNLDYSNLVAETTEIAFLGVIPNTTSACYSPPQQVVALLQPKL